MSFKKFMVKKPQAFQTASTVTLHACALPQNSLIPCTDIARVQIPDGKLISQCSQIEFPILQCITWRLFCSAIEEVRGRETLTCLTSQTSFKQDTFWKGPHLATDSYKGSMVSSVLILPIKYCYHTFPCLNVLDRRGVQGPNDFSCVSEYVGKIRP